MLCAECPRCRRRSIIGNSQSTQQLEEPSGEGGARLRCDLCGSRAVKVFRFASSIEALRFATGRR